MAYNESGYKYLVLIIHAKSYLFYMHGQLLSGGRCLNLGLSLYLHHSLCIRAVSSEDSGDLAHKHRHFRVLTD